MPKILAPGRLFLLTLALSLGTFIQLLDFSIANVSIPAITKDFQIDTSEGIWFITSYTVSSAIMLALTGWLASRFGHVNIFVISSLLFSLTSILCGFAWSNASLVSFRILQGIAGGALVPLSQTLLLMNYPPNERGKALGLWSLVVILAPLIGPFLGGYLTYHYGWRWIFFINLPLGIICSVVTYWLIGKMKIEESKQTRFDFTSFILLVSTVASFQIFLDKGHLYSWFSSNFIILMFSLSAVSLISFIIVNARSQNPIFDFSIFDDKNFVIGTIVASFAFFIFIGSSIILPLWLQLALHYTPLQAGLSLMPIGIIPLLFSTWVGRSLSKVDPRIYITLSFLASALTFFWFSTFTLDMDQNKFFILRVLQGLGPLFYFVPILTLSIMTIPRQKLASATGFFTFCRIISGGGIGIAVFVAFWEYKYHIYNKILNTQESDALLSSTAYTLAINDVAFWSGIGYLLAIPFIWLCTSNKRFIVD